MGRYSLVYLVRIGLCYFLLGFFCVSETGCFASNFILKTKRQVFFGGDSNKAGVYFLFLAHLYINWLVFCVFGLYCVGKLQMFGNLVSNIFFEC